MIRVNIDPISKEVVLCGDHFECRFLWHQALELGSQLQAAAIEVEPPAPPGRVYRPAAER